METCPHCGAELTKNAKTCPVCGSDEETGWSEQAQYDRLDLPDEDFDYDDFVNREFGGGKARPLGMHWFWWVIAVLILAGFAYLFLRSVLPR